MSSWVFLRSLVLAGFGRGGNWLLGCVSLYMCQFHNSLSSAMWSQFLRFPSGFCRSMVVVVPVVRHLCVVVSLVSSGSSAFKLLTIAFLLVARTPDLGRGFLTQAVMSSFGG